MARDTSKKQKFWEPAAPETLVYVGPNLSGDLSILTSTIYKNGLPAHLEKARKDDSNLAKMFVPVGDLAAARKLLKEPGSSLALAARNVAQRFAKE